MMGKGSDRGCGTHETACRPNSQFFSSTNGKEAEDSASRSEQKDSHVDFFSQARKVLSERSPYDVTEDPSAPSGSTSAVSSPYALPIGLTNLLRNSESRKKHKKSHSGGEKKSSRASERTKSQNVWIDTEEYFRELALQDMDTLFEVSSMPKWSDWKQNFLIPCPRLGKEDMDVILRQANECLQEDNTANEGESNIHENGSENKDLISDVVWVGGCRNRKFHKDRKSYKIEAGFEKILTAAPCEGNFFCDFCCRGDLSCASNKMIACSTCKMTVHRRCYGDCDTIDAKDWVCTACKQHSDVNSNEISCAICSKKGGALKPFAIDSKKSSSFAHIFCFIWTPDLYIDDVGNMGPIRTMEGAKEAKKTSMCGVCKSKSGTCIQCSYTACRATFHPNCGRENGHRMEVWGNHDRTEALLRTFCFKHSAVAGELESKGNLSEKGSQFGESSVASSKDASSVEESKNVSVILKKLIDRGNANVEDLAFEVDVSPDLLATAVANNGFSTELECKVCLWLGRNAHLVPSRGVTKTDACISNNGVEIDDRKVENIPVAPEPLDSRVTESARGKEAPSEGELSYLIHPSLTQKLKQAKRKLLSETRDPLLEASNSYGNTTTNEANLLQIPPEDDLEEELLYYQHKLLERVTSRKHLTDNLICTVAKNLPLEIDAARTRKWDAVLVNQYISNLREVKKQFRKERKHREAQAVLAAATAAAAASVRNPYFRKDAIDDQEKNASGRKPRETRSSNEKNSNSSKDNSLSCEVCRRNESLLNPIFVCSNCRVAVHVDCYRSVNESTGPWLCEPCEEQSTLESRQSALNSLERQQSTTQCAVCGGTSGAFRKTSDKQWVHAFCAEWALESAFRRGQAGLVDGVGALSREGHVCCVCQSNYGVCLKCGFGHCQVTFHPSCARTAGFFMTAKTLFGKHQHKSYCERHSADQRLKSETHKHGSEDLKGLKQIRVELEKLRLLCERIVKREKLKRELVTCSHNILSCKRDQLARSLRRRVPFPAEVSSESATTSLKGHVDGPRSFSDAVQRSDDVTVDSSVSIKQRVRSTLSNEDSSASQNPGERVPFGGKKIPRRFSPVPHSFDDGEWSSGTRRVFEKEVLMTSDQAFVKNRQLPKGYVYVPVKREKRGKDDRSSSETSDQNG